MIQANEPIQFHSYESGEWHESNGEVIVETPVSLTVNGEVWLVFMCTPTHLEALAAGFLFNEGLIHAAEEVASVRVCASGDNVDIWLNHAVEKPEKWRRTTGCTGGMTSVDVEEVDVSDQSPNPFMQANGFAVSPEEVSHLIGQLFETQDLYRRSGGVHTSAISDGKQIILSAEDIGRHNTLDKLAGRTLLEDIHLPHKVLLTTGRISSEMLQKARQIQAQVVISRTSPSSLSIQMAKKWGVTLIGYARRNRFTVYSHPERIQKNVPGANSLAHPIETSNFG